MLPPSNNGKGLPSSHSGTIHILGIQKEIQNSLLQVGDGISLRNSRERERIQNSFPGLPGPADGVKRTCCVTRGTGDNASQMPCWWRTKNIWLLQYWKRKGIIKWDYLCWDSRKGLWESFKWVGCLTKTCPCHLMVWASATHPRNTCQFPAVLSESFSSWNPVFPMDKRLRLH